MPKTYSDIVRFFRTTRSLVHRYEVVAFTQFNSSSTLGCRAFNKSALQLLPASHRCEASRGVSLIRRRIASQNCTHHHVHFVRNCSHCQESIDDEMACPLRDPASEQLNDYRRKFKVRPIQCTYRICTCST